MKRIFSFMWTSAVLLAVLAGCGQSSAGIVSGTQTGSLEQAAGSDHPAAVPPDDSASSGGAAPSASAAPSAGAQAGEDEIGDQDALAIALDNAGVPSSEAYNVTIQRDGDNGIPIYDIEFETDYGDYDFEIAIADGRIVGADYEVDEEALSSLGGSPISLEGVVSLVQEKVPGTPAEEIRVWEEGDDGQTRYEGELLWDGLKYEFEIDPQTGRIFDWNADLRG